MSDYTLSMDVIERNNVKVFGSGTTPMIFAHGYGCDQEMWRFITPAFATDHRIVLYDLTGFGQSDLAAFDDSRYATLDGHATDILEICDALDLRGAILVGHSVSAMTAVLAANCEPERFSSLIMVTPSPYYLNDGDYKGGFERTDIDGLIELLDANFMGWSNRMAPAIMGQPDRPELAEELASSFCRTDPEIAKQFGRVTFLSDHRKEAQALLHPALVLQCRDDILAPRFVGEWMAREVERAELTILDATGHCPHLSAPDETITAMRTFLTALQNSRDLGL